MPAVGSLGIQLITPHLYLFDPCGFFPSVTSAELRRLGLTVIYLSDTSGAHSHGAITDISGGAGGRGEEEELGGGFLCCLLNQTGAMGRQDRPFVHGRSDELSSRHWSAWSARRMEQPHATVR